MLTKRLSHINDSLSRKVSPAEEGVKTNTLQPYLGRAAPSACRTKCIPARSLSLTSWRLVSCRSATFARVCTKGATSQ